MTFIDDKSAAKVLTWAFEKIDPTKWKSMTKGARSIELVPRGLKDKQEVYRDRVVLEVSFGSLSIRGTPYHYTIRDKAPYCGSLLFKRIEETRERVLQEHHRRREFEWRRAEAGERLSAVVKGLPYEHKTYAEGVIEFVVQMHELRLVPLNDGRVKARLFGREILTRDIEGCVPKLVELFMDVSGRLYAALEAIEEEPEDDE